MGCITSFLNRQARHYLPPRIQLGGRFAPATDCKLSTVWVFGNDQGRHTHLRACLFASETIDVRDLSVKKAEVGSWLEIYSMGHLYFRRGHMFVSTNSPMLKVNVFEALEYVRLPPNHQCLSEPVGDNPIVSHGKRIDPESPLRMSARIDVSWVGF